ncbi:MAG: hypothetical protein ABIL09_12110 [Gemmatimonadota bacterium]
MATPDATRVLVPVAPALPDRRAVELRASDTPYTLRRFASRVAWEARAEHIRQRILTCSGLWPIPERPPLRPRVFGRIERGGYSVEKVFFESLPGFYVGGNLYRPADSPRPVPGIACPHGHWGRGRLEHQETCSVPGRCINLALQGMAAFSYDMVGYNDCDQLDHRPFASPREELWGIGSLGLQLWNSIRVLDFLEQLDGVDPRRLGCTGASGGGTQTFLLAAVDDRVAAAAPVNMISAHMQGGCTCENQGHLRLDINNVEIGAAMAPRPQLLVAATGDWTANTPQVEYPAIRAVYELYGARDRLEMHQVDAGHNYNRESREAVYRFFARWLGSPSGRRRAESARRAVREKAFEVEADVDLLAFAGRPKPAGALDASGVAAALVRRCEQALTRRRPTDRSSLKAFCRLMKPALSHALAASAPDPTEVRARNMGRDCQGDLLVERFLVGRCGEGDRIPAVLLSPARGRSNRSPAALIAHPAGKAGLFDGRGRPRGLAAALLADGHRVLALDLFLTGEAADGADAEAYHAARIPHFHTYNASVAACRVQDLLTALAFLEGRPDVSRRHLVGLGACGVPCLLARGLAGKVDRTWAEVQRFAFEDDEAWAQSCFAPALRSAGDVRTALALAAPAEMLVSGANASFPTAWARAAYRAAGRSGALSISRRRLNAAQGARWLARPARAQ